VVDNGSVLPVCDVAELDLSDDVEVRIEGRIIPDDDELVLVVVVVTLVGVVAGSVLTQ